MSALYFKVPADPQTGIRFSGHQSFPLRIAWIPKAAFQISIGQDPFTNPDDGIVSLGIGKNMVEALRCWVEAYQVATRDQGAWSLSKVGEFLFGQDGRDPFLEDPTTPWLLHWLISTNRQAPLGAWECLVNRWPAAAFCQSEVIEALARMAAQNPKPCSEATLRQHWEVFLHTYLEPRGRNDDSMDSAISNLRLIVAVGEKPSATGRWETSYAFDRGWKSGISRELFAYFLLDWWDRMYPDELTVPVREAITGLYSPGSVLKMQEDEILIRLEELSSVAESGLSLVESATIRQIRRSPGLASDEFLGVAYAEPTFPTT